MFGRGEELNEKLLIRRFIYFAFLIRCVFKSKLNLSNKKLLGFWLSFSIGSAKYHSLMVQIKRFRNKQSFAGTKNWKNNESRISEENINYPRIILKKKNCDRLER